MAAGAATAQRRRSRQIMPEVRVRLATNDFSLAGTELAFVDGSRMRNDFTNSVANSSLDETLFQWKAALLISKSRSRLPNEIR